MKCILDAYFVSSTLCSNRCSICRTVLFPMFCLDTCLLMKLQPTDFKCVARLSMLASYVKQQHLREELKVLET
jgi:hypothetical protein